MKSIRSLIIIFFLGLFLVIYLESVQAQTGNQSDTTGPDPQEFMNQSDTTGNDPQEIIIPINNNNNTNIGDNTSSTTLGGQLSSKNVKPKQLADMYVEQICYNLK